MVPRGARVKKEVYGMYAIIESGGKQFKVSAGDVIKVEKLGIEAGGSYVFDKVMAVYGEEGAKFGKPYIDGASVTGSVLGQGKDKKLIVYKFKSKKGFHKKKGHRQPFTKVRIDGIAE